MSDDQRVVCISRPSTWIALRGLTGHKFSHAPQPIQYPFTYGIVRFFPLRVTSIMDIAPAGQWRAQFPHDSPIDTDRQESASTTAYPMLVELFSAAVIGCIAPSGHMDEHSVHSGRQYPRSYPTTGCMNESSSADGRRTSFGQALIQS